MLKRTFDLRLPYRVVIYLRMSSDEQNKRSPDQQRAEIMQRLRNAGLPWVIVKEFRDDAKSGRYLRKRIGYQKMLREIKTRSLQVDLILVDTIERFGRVEELQSIRKELFEKSGVLVLTADTNFADPTTPQGKALGAFEAMRATEDTRVKAHNVFRGKRDAAMQKHWPGGPPPFGFMLRSIMKEEHGRQVVDFCILVPNPETDWIMKLLLGKAAETGWGQTRLTRYLNQHPDIPDRFKPFQASTVGYWLRNVIYVGDLRWAANSTDVIDDARVIERNAEEDVVFVADFCEPLVPREVWDKIQAVRNARRRPRTLATDGESKQLEAPAPGLTLKYLLTGLVRCGLCTRAMAPSSTALYTTLAGEQHRYTYYVCPGHIDSSCTNSQRIPEEWLRKTVIEKLRDRLFPASAPNT